MEKVMHFSEKYGQLGDKSTYIIGNTSEVVGLKGCERRRNSKSVLSWLADWLRFALLPQGYPASVSEDYLSYQLWDTLQAFCSYLSGTLTTKAIMQGVGVGDASATPLAATITWIMRDGTGMIGRIVFASWKGPSLDANCKQWRLAADVLNDLAMTLELTSPLLPERLFPWALCLATCMKSIVGVAGGATRAALTQHQAHRNNMADVAAKDGSQETLVNLIASVTGIFLLPLLTSDVYAWFLFLCLSCIHLYANYRAVRCLNIPILNAQRFNLLLESYSTPKGKRIEKPSVINFRESVFLGSGFTGMELCGFEIKLGASLGDVSEISPQQLRFACNLNSEYVVLPSVQRRKISVMFHQSCCDSPPALRAYFHAFTLAGAIQQFQNKEFENKHSGALLENAMTTASNYVADKFAEFESAAGEKGWVMDRHQLLVDEWQADWFYVSKKMQ